MKIIFLLFCVLFFSSHAQSFEAFKKEQNHTADQEKKAFQKYKKDLEAEFDNYLKELDAEYTSYKKELSVYWKEPKLSTEKKWLHYSKDKKTRTTVGFDTDTITIEVIAKRAKEAELRLKMALAKVVLDDTKSAIQGDELQQRIVKIEKKHTKLIAEKTIKPEAILTPIIFEKSPSREKLITYVNKKVIAQKVTTKPSKVHNEKIYTLHVKLPSDTMMKRSRHYEELVRKNANRFKLPVPLVFAIIHTESSYNPFAKSHIPAYGLMQIVPRSAGIDSYVFLHNEKKIPSATYLYDSKKNIEMGSAYLHILYYRYLKKVKNPTSRLYCTIAAYNTGAGNVAYAFVQSNNVTKASKKINALPPKAVYSHLLKHLKYKEARNYLSRVSSRFNAYKKVYKEDTVRYLHSGKIVY